MQLTMYVGPARQQDLVEPIIALAPKRVIFNPGTENPVAYAQLQAAGIEVIEACTFSHAQNQAVPDEPLARSPSLSASPV